MLGLISSAGGHGSCLESIAAMATEDSLKPQAKIELLKFVFPGASEVLQMTRPS